MESLEETLRRVAAGRGRAEAEGAEQRYLARSRGRLAAIVRKKLTTSFVGALARFEEHFGAVWGRGLPDSRLTPEQRAWRGVWERCRTEVLNNGNNQARAVENEFPQYTVRWDRYVTVLPAAGADPGVESESTNTEG